MPRRRGEREVTSLLPAKTAPRSGGRRPPMAASSVVLPAPAVPRMTVMAPAAAEKDTSASTVRRARCTVRPRTEREVMMCGGAPLVCGAGSLRLGRLAGGVVREGGDGLGGGFDVRGIGGGEMANGALGVHVERSKLENHGRARARAFGVAGGHAVGDQVGVEQGFGPVVGRFVLPG